ncbi:MAG: TolC family protein, partial [Zoogloea sp.]|nr:TolC family protein [Zoogloea sp.]
GVLNDSRALLVLQAQPGAGLSAGSGVDAAVARRDSVRMSYAAAERDLQERVTQDWNEWSAARLRLESAAQSQVMAAEVSESYARQYVAGRKSWLDVLNSVREATQAAFSVEDARSQALAAGMRLRAQCGKLDMQQAEEEAQ